MNLNLAGEIIDLASKTVEVIKKMSVETYNEPSNMITAIGTVDNIELGDGSIVEFGDNTFMCIDPETRNQIYLFDPLEIDDIENMGFNGDEPAIELFEAFTELEPQNGL